MTAFLLLGTLTALASTTAAVLLLIRVARSRNHWRDLAQHPKPPTQVTARLVLPGDTVFVWACRQRTQSSGRWRYGTVAEIRRDPAEHLELTIEFEDGTTVYARLHAAAFVMVSPFRAANPGFPGPGRLHDPTTPTTWSFRGERLIIDHAPPAFLGSGK